MHHNRISPQKTTNLPLGGEFDLEKLGGDSANNMSVLWHHRRNKIMGEKPVLFSGVKKTAEAGRHLVNAEEPFC